MSKQSLLESTAEAVAERTATAGEKLGRMAGWSVVATIAVHGLTTFRDYTVLLLLNGGVRLCTDERGQVNYLGQVFSFIAQTYDHTWGLIIGAGS